MGLSNVVEKAEAAKTATPQTATPAPVAKGKKAQSEMSILYDNFRAEGHAIRDAKSEEEKALEGSKSDKVAFIGCLGDPAVGQFRKATGENIPSIKVVGYKFKALEDMQVPVAKLKVGFKNFLDTEEVTFRQVKEGEEFDLNALETGYLAGQNEYAGTFSGEGKVVVLSVKFSKDRPEPLPILKTKDKGSVKENMYEIADNVGDETKKIWKVKDEYAEKFDVLYMKRSTGKPGSSNKNTKTKESTADIAAAFLNYINNRK